jgi:hypothetical protein
MKSEFYVIPAMLALVGFAQPGLAVPPGGFIHGGPPASVTMGPPASVTMGPPAGALAHIPQGVPMGKPADLPPDAGVGNAAHLLGSLNAAHASPTALEHASPNSMVGAIAIYKNATITAEAAVTKYTGLVSADQTAVTDAQANLTSAEDALTALKNSGTATQQQLTDAQTAVTDAQTALDAANTQLSADQASLASAQADIVSAQTTLAARANKPLTPDVISQLNSLLGI